MKYATSIITLTLLHLFSPQSANAYSFGWTRSTTATPKSELNQNMVRSSNFADETADLPLNELAKRIQSAQSGLRQSFDNEFESAPFMTIWQLESGLGVTDAPSETGSLYPAHMDQSKQMHRVLGNLMKGFSGYDGQKQWLELYKTTCLSDKDCVSAVEESGNVAKMPVGTNWAAVVKRNISDQVENSKSSAQLADLVSGIHAVVSHDNCNDPAFEYFTGVQSSACLELKFYPYTEAIVHLNKFLQNSLQMLLNRWPTQQKWDAYWKQQQFDDAAKVASIKEKIGEIVSDIPISSTLVDLETGKRVFREFYGTILQIYCPACSMTAHRLFSGLGTAFVLLLPDTDAAIEIEPHNVHQLLYLWNAASAALDTAIARDAIRVAQIEPAIPAALARFALAQQQNPSPSSGFKNDVLQWISFVAISIVALSYI